MTDNALALCCLVDGESTFNAFSVEMEYTMTIGDLKDAIKTKMAPRFDDVATAELILWYVSIPEIATDRHQPVHLNTIISATELGPFDVIANLFTETPPENIIHILVQRPPSVTKRVHEEDTGLSFMRKRHCSNTLLSAIEDAGLAKVAVVDGESDLSRLDNKQRVVLLDCIGQEVDRSDGFWALLHTARKLQGINMNDINKISTPHGTYLPVIHANELFIREAYKDLRDTILGAFENTRHGSTTGKHVLVTGTSGIGVSTFLVYFTIRLLIESNDSEPPIIIFHTRHTAECYVFGGRSTLRSGSINDFKPFLKLPDTWYFVDSSPDPILDRAKTVISASLMTLFSETPQYADINKRVVWRYYMAPWSLEELKKCRANLVSFQEIPLKDIEDLYSKIGGVPRYVLDWPLVGLNLCLTDIEGAKGMACRHLREALDTVKDPAVMMRFSSQVKDTLGFGCCLIHRWPTNDHRRVRLEWASPYAAEKFASLLNQDVYTQMLERIIMDPHGSASGIIFEACILRIFREGGHTFEIKNLETGETGRLEISQKPGIKHFSSIPSVFSGTLCIPADDSGTCVDMQFSPSDLFQITKSEIHLIKGPPLLKLLSNLVQGHWIPPDERRLIFVVPSQVYANFGKQNYLTSEGEVFQTFPVDMQPVKQYVLKIDLKSAAAAGKSSGLQSPMQQNAETTN